MGFISTSLKLGSFLAAAFAVLIGVFFGTSIPKSLGFYHWLKTINPRLVGLYPIFTSEWNFSFEDLAKQNLTGQRAIVTGANSGIGYATTEQLYKLGAEVIMACRNPSKCEKAANEIVQANSKVSRGGVIKTMTIDTGSLASVKKFAQEYLQEYNTGNQHKPLDMLFLNAGFFYANKDRTQCIPQSVDGIESVFATNYLGHHLLYRLLEPSLLRQRSSSKMGGAARVVSTSSCASYGTFPYVVATDLSTLNGCYKTKGGGLLFNHHFFLSYGQSKLAQILWTKCITRRNGPSSNIYVNAYHPGDVYTEIWGKTFGMAQLPQRVINIVNWFQQGSMWNKDQGALTGLFLGTAVNELKQKDIRGKYYHPQSIEMENELANNITLQDQLWEFSELLVKDYLIMDVENDEEEGPTSVREEQPDGDVLEE